MQCFITFNVMCMYIDELAHQRISVQSERPALSQSVEEIMCKRDLPTLYNAKRQYSSWVTSGRQKMLSILIICVWGLKFSEFFAN